MEGSSLSNNLSTTLANYSNTNYPNMSLSHSLSLSSSSSSLPRPAPLSPFLLSLTSSTSSPRIPIPQPLEDSDIEIYKSKILRYRNKIKRYEAQIKKCENNIQFSIDNNKRLHINKCISFFQQIKWIYTDELFESFIDFHDIFIKVVHEIDVIVEEIDMSAIKINFYKFQNIISHCPKLKILTLGKLDTNIISNIFYSLEYVTVSHLTLCNSVIDHIFLIDVNFLNKSALRHLSIYDCKISGKILDDLISYFNDGWQLQSLNVNNVNLSYNHTNKLINSIVKSKYIKSLNIAGNNMITIDNIIKLINSSLIELYIPDSILQLENTIIVKELVNAPFLKSFQGKLL